MQNGKVLTVAALAMTLSALGAGYGLKKVPIARPHVLPIETMPRQVGEWTAGEDRPADADVRQKLPTARIVDRLYTNKQGVQLNLMLVTADERDDIHNPTICFPSQGWQIERLQSFRQGGDTATLMQARQNTNRVDVYYWMTGYFAPRRPDNALLRNVANWRDRMVGRQEGMSLFVRLMVNRSEQSEALLRDFAEQIRPSIEAMKAGVYRTL